MGHGKAWIFLCLGIESAKKEILEEILVETKLSSLNFEAKSTPKEKF